MPESVLDLGIQRGTQTSKQVFAVSTRQWSVVFGVRTPALLGTSFLVTLLCTGHSLYIFCWFLLIFPTLKQRRDPRLQPSLLYLYSLLRWSLKALYSICCDSHLSFEPWEIYSSSLDLFSEPRFIYLTTYLPTPLGSLLEISHLKAPKHPNLPWVNLLFLSFPISATGSSILLVAQANTLEVILDISILPQPTILLALPSRHIHQGHWPGPKASSSPSWIIAITFLLGSLLPDLYSRFILNKWTDMSF